MTPGTSRLVPLRCLKIAPKSAFKVSASGSTASNSRALPGVESAGAGLDGGGGGAGAGAVLWGFWVTAARVATHIAATAVSAAPHPRLTRSKVTRASLRVRRKARQRCGVAYSRGPEVCMGRMTLPVVLATALAPAAAGAAGAVQRGSWTMPAKDYASTRYSELREITPASAPRLRPVWTFSTGVLGGHEGQPLVVDRTMYVVTPYPNVLYAFDLSTEGYPLKWKYRPAVDPKAIGIACCDVINRGAVYADGKVVYNLLDGHTVAVAAATGRELWRTTIANLAEGETTPVAPFVVKNRVIVGASGGEFGIHGSLKALDLETGRIVWTAYNTGPDSEVLARAGTFKPFYDRGAELGLRSWPPDVWSSGG